jgi:hypothetical protein
MPTSSSSDSQPACAASYFRLTDERRNRDDVCPNVWLLLGTIFHLPYAHTSSIRGEQPVRKGVRSYGMVRSRRGTEPRVRMPLPPGGESPDNRSFGLQSGRSWGQTDSKVNRITHSVQRVSPYSIARNRPTSDTRVCRYRPSNKIIEAVSHVSHTLTTPAPLTAFN